MFKDNSLVFAYIKESDILPEVESRINILKDARKCK